MGKMACNHSSEFFHLLYGTVDRIRSTSIEAFMWVERFSHLILHKLVNSPMGRFDFFIHIPKFLLRVVLGPQNAHLLFSEFVRTWLLTLLSPFTWRQAWKMSRDVPQLLYASYSYSDTVTLIGLLNVTCTVVAPGHAYLCRLINLTKGIQTLHHHIRLSKGAKLDILIWLRFLKDFFL